MEANIVFCTYHGPKKGSKYYRTIFVKLNFFHVSHTNPLNDRLVEVPRSMPLLFRRDKTKESKQPNVCHDLAEKYTAVLIRILQ